MLKLFTPKNLVCLKSKLRSEAFHVQRMVFNQFCVPSSPRILVLGNQKAGTSAIAALLAKRTNQSVQIDFPDVSYLLDDLMAVDYVSVKRYASYLTKQIIKEPNLTFYSDKSIELFAPDAVLFIVRDPIENIRSIMNRLSLSGCETLRDVPDRRQIPHTWNAILGGRWTPRGESIVDTLAIRWCLAAEAYLRSSEKCVLAKYEDFHSAKTAEIDRIARALGLEPSLDISKWENHSFQPKGRATAGFFSKENLDRIQQQCGELARELGYGLEREESDD